MLRVAENCTLSYVTRKNHQNNDVPCNSLNLDDWRRAPLRPASSQARIRAVLREQGGLCLFGKSGHANEVWVDPLYEQKVAR